MIINEFHFIRPYWLLAFLPLLVLIFLSIKSKLQQGNWQAVCDPELLPFVLQEKDIQHSRLPLISSSLAAVLCIIALAGPAWQRIPTPVFRNAAALVIALDLSRSMDATDIKPSRLERARYKIADLLKKRKDGQTALLVYANSAFTVTPLTDDTATINNQLPALTSDIMPAQGSNSAQGIQLAQQLFKNAGLQKGQILLVTDDDNIEQSFAQAELSSTYQLSILAVGTAAGAPIKLAQGGFLKDASGNIVLPKLDSRAMQKVAQAGGGIYQQITASDKDIDKLSAHFDNEAQRGAATENDLLLENWVEAGVWLLFPILFLSALSFRRGLLSLLFIFLLPIPKNSYAFEWQDLWQTKAQQAQQKFLQGDYQQAAEQFTHPAWQAAAQYKANTKVSEKDTLLQATTDTGFYNQGNVLAKSGQLEKAMMSYAEALELNPDNEDAQFNKDLVEKELEKQKKQQQQQNQDQKQENKEQSEEQKGEQSGNDSQQQGQQGEQAEDQSDPQQAENSQTQQDSQQKDSSAEQENDKQAEQQSAESTEQETQEEQKEAESAKQNETDARQSEQDQANQQWLRSIPDDPSGLLKRKFKYQYGRQQQRQNSAEQW